MKVFDQVVNNEYAIYHGDSCEVMQGIPDNSIGYSMFSPPFAELYTYSDSDADLGNSKSYNEFFDHFYFIISELYRVIMPGRLVSVHCIDIPAMKERDGYIGLKDFPGDIIRHFQNAGFIYHSRVTIWKNPLIEATRTKAIGLMHKQLCKDSAMCRQGLPDYVITMRKPGENLEPISHGDGIKEFIGENEPTETGIKYSHEVWRRYASPVWMDINQSDTLNFRIARGEKDEKHICPLQLGVIERCMELWSNHGDTFLTPFAGIGSEAFIAIKKGRKPVAIELKQEYYDQMKVNVIHGHDLKNENKLFED
jgi:DNA modification methylase